MGTTIRSTVRVRNRMAAMSSAAAPAASNTFHPDNRTTRTWTWLFTGSLSIKRLLQEYAQGILETRSLPRARARRSIDADYSVFSGSCAARRGQPRRRQRHPGRQSKHFQEADDRVGRVELPPAMAEARRARIRVVVVVPTLAVGEVAEDEVVAAALVGLVVAIAEAVGHRVHGPGRVPLHHGAHEHAPHEAAEAELSGLARGSAERELGREAAAEEHQPRK